MCFPLLFAPLFSQWDNYIPVNAVFLCYHINEKPSPSPAYARQVHVFLNHCTLTSASSVTGWEVCDGGLGVDLSWLESATTVFLRLTHHKVGLWTRCPPRLATSPSSLVFLGSATWGFMTGARSQHGQRPGCDKEDNKKMKGKKNGWPHAIWHARTAWL